MHTFCSNTKLWILVLAVVCDTAISALGQEINIVVPNEFENSEARGAGEYLLGHSVFNKSSLHPSSSRWPREETDDC